MIRETTSSSAAGPWNGRTARAGRGLLDRVLERWEVAASPEDGLPGLDALHSAYLSRVPFENATKLVKASRAGSPRGCMRDPVEFWEDHLRWGSGGTCFAATSAYQFLLRYLGFDAVPVFCQLPASGEDAHAALVVTLGEDRVLVDVGYALPLPIVLPGDAPTRRQTPFYDVEVRPGPGGEYLVFSEDHRGQRYRYRMVLREIPDTAFRGAWARTFDARAPYMRRLALGRFDATTRYLYKDASRVYEITRAGERSRELPEPRIEALSAVFGLPRPLLEAAQTALQRAEAHRESR